ncbi:hypothetical protein ACTMTI_40135 [Nonomuraea sp. H19]|uniref:hypothetical protein n=1 Tax=Nonomuraea sp. H19 TaxID=3452206 RepID=UPI003F8A5C71
MITPSYSRSTRLCAVDDLDVRLQVLLDGYAEQHLLEDLRESARICCETHSVPLQQSRRGLFRGRALAPMAVENRAAAVVTDTFVVIVLVRVDGESVRLGGRLADAVLEVPNPQVFGGETGVFVHARWLGHSEASSYLLPLDSGSDGQAFLARLRDLSAAARTRL